MLKNSQESWLERTQRSRCLKGGGLKPFGSQSEGNHSGDKTSRDTRKETVDIDLLVTSRNGDREIVDTVRKTSGSPTRIRKCNQFSQFRRTPTKLMPIGKTEVVPEKQQVQRQQSCIYPFLQLIQHIKEGTRCTSHSRLYGRFSD